MNHFQDLLIALIASDLILQGSLRSNPVIFEVWGDTIFAQHI